MKFWLQLGEQDWGRRRNALEERSHLLNKVEEKPVSSYKTGSTESSQRSRLTSRRKKTEKKMALMWTRRDTSALKLKTVPFKSHPWELQAGGSNT